MRYSAIKNRETQSSRTKKSNEAIVTTTAILPASDIKGRVINLGGRYLKKAKYKSRKKAEEFDSSGLLHTPEVKQISRKKRPDMAIKDTEELYKNLFNKSPFAIGILDKETLKLLEVNETATKLYGYSEEEFLRLTAYDIRIPEQHNQLRSLIEKGNYTDDKTIRSHKKQNGDIIQIEPSITEITYKGKPAYLMTIHDITEKLMMQEELNRAKITRSQEITRASLQAQEKSRTDIGRELHDNINQLLVASILFLKKAQPASVSDKELADMGIDIIGTAIAEIRKLSSSLVSPSLSKVSLKESICHLLPSLTVSNTAVELDIRINEAEMPEELKINLFRIIQEQFSNIIKHAAAAKVKVTILQSPSLVTLEIGDNGIGFDQKQQARGIGLDNILHRVDSYNGKVFIESSPGNGCWINVEIPVHPAQFCQ